MNIFGLLYRDSINDILKQKQHKYFKKLKENLNPKKIWTFKCFKMDLILKSPYDLFFDGF